MGYFDEKKNVVEYIQMADGYDGRDLVDVLARFLPSGATVLELGMGPGKDLDMLSEKYAVTGSDLSDVFIDLYKKKNAAADLLKLDAVTIETDRKFDCIYSNKVLHHVRKPDLRRSFSRQEDVLNDEGLLLHSFWLGEKEELMSGLLFVYYMEEELLKMVGPGFEVLEMERYNELEEEDSFYILLRKKTGS